MKFHLSINFTWQANDIAHTGGGVLTWNFLKFIGVRRLSEITENITHVDNKMSSWTERRRTEEALVEFTKHVFIVESIDDIWDLLNGHVSRPLSL